MEQIDAIVADHFSLEQNGQLLLDRVSVRFPARGVSVIIGPANAGKTALLRAMNRLAEEDGAVKISGTLSVFGQNIYRQDADPLQIRRLVGMVFRKPSLMAASIFDNVAIALRIMGTTDIHALNATIEQSLRDVDLWDICRLKLNASAHELSAEQQQRLCLARVLAMKPAVIVMDEPTADFDPPSAARMESLIHTLGERIPIIVSTNSPQEAAHIGDYAVFLLDGRVIEASKCEQLLTCPTDARTEAYVMRRS